MSLREEYPHPGWRYSFSLTGSDGIRWVGLGRTGVWAIAALALLSFTWATSVTLYVAFHDDVIGAILAHQLELKAAYEDRLAEANARLDEASSRQLFERNSFKGAVSEIISRQARLEQRGGIVAELAETAARNLHPPAGGRAPTPDPSDALSAIQNLAPPVAVGASVNDAARAYAPLPDAEPPAAKPHPIDESGETLSALPLDGPFTTASVKEPQTLSIPGAP